MPIPHAYAHGRERLDDELRRLDLLLKLQMIRVRRRFSDDRPDHLRGLYITDEEVGALLPAAGGDAAPHVPSSVTTSLGRESHEYPGIRNTRETSESDWAPEDNSAEEALLASQAEQLRVLIDQRSDAAEAAGLTTPLGHLSRQFNLSPLEQDTLMLCLAAELNPSYAKVFSYLQDDVTRKWPSPELAMELFGGEPRDYAAGRLHFTQHGTLFHHRLIELHPEDASLPLLARGLHPDPGIVDYLLEFNALDSRLIPFTRILTPLKQEQLPASVAELRVEWNNLLRLCINPDCEQSMIFYLYGPDGGGRHTAARFFAGATGLSLLAADLRVLTQEPEKLENRIRLLFREALLHPCCICLEYFDRLTPVSGREQDERVGESLHLILQLCRSHNGLIFLLGERNWNPGSAFDTTIFIQREFPVLPFRTRRQIWESALKNMGPDVRPDSSADAAMLANKFQFTPGQIHGALNNARTLALKTAKPDQTPALLTAAHLHQACRTQSNQKLAELAQKIFPRYAWSDIVLPPDQLEQLHEICRQAEYRHMVFDEWDFDAKFSLGKGINVLFSGASGAGKTMASEIIARQLDMDLYKIDLSTVVSKYIGETEKNLARIFQEAKSSNAILLFDEADALFGKRSEVKDAHDRYANIEINYLLQKMEEHEGIVVLTTNFRKNIDDAFTRRFRFAVEFPFPDPPYRLQIWKQVFPRKTPLAEDLDFDFLARRFKITGGSIKNIALHSAFLAAADGRVVRMAHLVRATRREIQKMGELCQPGDFGKYAPLLDL